MKRLLVFLCAMFLVFGFAFPTHAAFIDLGGGMVYDDILDITWLQDANFAQSSGYDTDGLMTWDDANTWAASLMVGGTGGWRLPTFDPSNTRPGEITPDNPTFDPMLATSANEIGSLLMALTEGEFDLYFPPYTAADISPFTNLPHLVSDEIYESVYWTGLAGDAGNAWDYYMGCG